MKRTSIFLYKPLLKKSIYCWLVTLFSTMIFSQNGNIRGFVYDKESGEPLTYITVFLKGTNYGVQSDGNGFFSITKIKAGKYTLKFQTMDRDSSFQETFTIGANEFLNKKFYVPKAPFQLEEVNVDVEQQNKELDPNRPETIDPIKIAKLPSVGEPDLAQYLQILPGVVFTGDQGGQLYIRGGAPIQNKVLLDGMIIYNPFHSIGLFSVFDADIIRNADVYSAAFGAEYGGRTSSVMDVTTRDGNKKRIAGKISGSPFGAKTLIEGPLIKLKEDGKGSASFLISAKTSYLPFTSKYLYPYAVQDMQSGGNSNTNNGLPFSFNDYYGKVSFNAENGSKLNLFGFNFNDKVDYSGIAKFAWKSLGAGTNFVLIPSGSNVLVEGNFAYSQYNIGETEGTNLEANRKSDINSFNAGFKFTNFIGKNEIKYGFEMIGLKTNFSLLNSAKRLISQDDNTTEIAGFVSTKFVSKNKKIVFEPSLRGHYYASLLEFSPEPRFAFKFNISKKIRYRLAGGFYSQNLVGGNSDRDIPNLFYGFLSGSDNLPETLTQQDGSVKSITRFIQKANHLLTGIEFDMIKNFEIKIEAYQKTFTQLTNINRDKIFDENDLSAANEPDYKKKDFIVETGWARGLDFVIKYDRKRFYFWTIYSITYNERWDGHQEYAPVWDRRHNVNLVSSYTFGKKKRWEVNARWNLGSGFPFTPTQGYFPAINTNGNVGIDPTSVNGSLGYIAGPLNSSRLPYYHRLDINIKYKYKLAENRTIEITAGATNTYNRQNVFYRARNTGVTVYQLPILPSVNASFTF